MLGLNDKPGLSASAKHAAFFSCLSKRNDCLSSTTVRAKHAKLASDSVLASKPTGGLSSTTVRAKHAKLGSVLVLASTPPIAVLHYY
jgi:hypothetical protein